MWAGGDSWLEQITKAWPILVAATAVAQMLINRFARGKATDKEVQTMAKTIEVLVKNDAAFEEKISRLQSDVRREDERITEACKDITSTRDRVDKNTSTLDYMLGRMDFGKNQRPGGQNDKR